LCWRGRGRAADAEVVDGVFNEAEFEVERLAHEAASSRDLIDDKAGVVGGKLHFFFEENFMHDDLEQVIGEGHAALVALGFEDVVVGVPGGRADFDLVREAAEEGWVHQLLGLEVGGEDDHGFEARRCGV